MIHRILGPRLSRYVQQRYFSAAKLRWKLSSGVKIEILSTVDWCLYNDIFVDGEYDLAIERALNCSSQNQGISVLDLGSNVGFFILRLMDRAKRTNNKKRIRVVAVEPDTKNIEEINRRVVSQAFENLDLQILEGIVGRREGQAVLYTTHNYHAHTIDAAKQYSGSKPRPVSYLNLETLCPGVQWDLVKCDIEGAEGEFVENYIDLLRRTQTFVLEVHHGSCEIGKLRSVLRDAGLKTEHVIVDHGSNSMHIFTRDEQTPDNQ